MSIHCYPELLPGESIEDVIAREEAGEDTIESQDNAISERQDRRHAEAVYFRTIRREGIKSKRKNLAKP